jgi:hypothetical protein
VQRQIRLGPRGKRCLRWGFGSFRLTGAEEKQDLKGAEARDYVVTQSKVVGKKPQKWTDQRCVSSGRQSVLWLV